MKRVIPNIKVIIPENVDLSLLNLNLISENQNVVDLIIPSAFNGIKEAVSRKWKQAKICEINSTGTYVTVEKDKFSDLLDNILPYYVDREEYEICSEIITLKNKING